MIFTASVLIWIAFFQLFRVSMTYSQLSYLISICSIVFTAVEINVLGVVTLQTWSDTDFHFHSHFSCNSYTLQVFNSALCHVSASSAPISNSSVPSSLFCTLSHYTFASNKTSTFLIIWIAINLITTCSFNNAWLIIMSNSYCIIVYLILMGIVVLESVTFWDLIT